MGSKARTAGAQGSVSAAAEIGAALGYSGFPKVDKIDEAAFEAVIRAILMLNARLRSRLIADGTRTDVAHRFEMDVRPRSVLRSRLSGLDKSQSDAVDLLGSEFCAH